MIENKHQQIYTGITLDWQRRFKEHKQQGAKCAKALKGKAPLYLRYCIKLPNRRTAMQAEIWLKKQKRSVKLDLIKQTSTLPFEGLVLDLHQLSP